MGIKEERLKKLDTAKLIDVVKNYRQYGYDENLRAAAISILEERGVPKEHLELTGNFENKNYDIAEKSYKIFIKNSTITFFLYLLILIFFINYNTAAPSVLIFKLILYILYFIFLVKSFINQSQIYKAIGKDYDMEGALVYLFLGMPFYMFMYFYFRNQLKELMTDIK